MYDFVAQYSKTFSKNINTNLIDRTKEMSIADYIVSGLKIIESLPYIKFVSAEHITDASKIDFKLNRRHIKSKTILKDKEIEKIVSIRNTAQEMLILKFQIDYDGETRYITKELLIPSYIDKYHLLINGKKILPILQIVDNSTYSQQKSLKLKTILTPIDVYRDEKVLVDTEGLSHQTKPFVLNLFTKELNPLYYFFAKFGATKAIKYFGLSKVADITDKVYDAEINYYFPIKTVDNIFVEVDKRYFDESDFIRSFIAMVQQILRDELKPTNVFDEIHDSKFWTSIIGSKYTTNTKNFYSKGCNVLISFERILDEITKKTLRLSPVNVQSTYSLLRWMLCNYTDLRKKDNHDLELKRIRCNEVIAFFFIQSMTSRINTLLNKKKLQIESIEKIFGWNNDELFRLLISSQNSLLKYDPDINDFDMLNALRFSFQGTQGLGSGKNVSAEFRDIYPSHLGRIDLNAISHGRNTCLSGFIVPMCKTYNGGFFAKENKDPDNYTDYMKYLKMKFNDDDINIRKSKIDELKDERLKEVDRYMKIQQFEVRDGLVVIHRCDKNQYKILRNELTDQTIIAARNPKLGYKRSYIDKDGILRDENGYARIKSRHPIPETGYVRIKARPKPIVTEESHEET